jgi:hypothetical protein
MKRKKKASQPLNRSTSQPARGAHKAFLEAGGHLFLGEKLQPYTPSRVVAAQAMGLLYPKIGDAGAAQFKNTGMYAGELKDMIIVLWLCRLGKDDQVSAARMDPIAAYGVAEKWAGKAGLCDTGSDVFNEGLLTFMLIMNEIGESKTRPAGKAGSRRGGSDDEEEPDPND